jgi:hypothetical protein
VVINVNGVLGEVRNSSEVGVPQGSALSPILFRIFLMDFLEDLQGNKSVSFMKFADDGTVKVTGSTSAECLQTMKAVIDSVETWVNKWRMVVNCAINKTEMICFGTSENDKTLIPKTFNICGTEINLVSQTTVLGLVLDEHLNFKEHGKMVYKKLVGRWAQVCTYSNRHWGLNQRVMRQIIKTIFQSSIFYASHIWMSKDNMMDINKFYYKLLKSAVGAVFNIRHSTAEVILGLPPLPLINKCNLVKHYLKIIINNTPGDRMKKMLNDELTNHSNSGSVVNHSLRQVYNYLKWKVRKHGQGINENDKAIIESGNISEFLSLSPETCKYTKAQMEEYTVMLWRKSLENEFLQDGLNVIPIPTCKPLLLDSSTSRQVEVLTLSLMYDNNLLQSFLHRFDRQKYSSPLCPCGDEEQTAFHLLLRCSLVPPEFRAETLAELKKVTGQEVFVESSVTILNASRSPKFIHSVTQTLSTIKDTLRTEIEL